MCCVFTAAAVLSWWPTQKPGSQTNTLERRRENKLLVFRTFDERKTAFSSASDVITSCWRTSGFCCCGSAGLFQPALIVRVRVCFSGSSGGICEKSKLYSDGKKKSLNTGIITVQNYASHVPPKVSHITFAHEVGHNFGSPVGFHSILLI